MPMEPYEPTSGPARRGAIGVVVESTEGPWFTQLLSGIEEALVTANRDLVLVSLTPLGRFDATCARRAITERTIDGLVFAGMTRRDRALQAAADSAGIPSLAVSPDEPLDDHDVVRGNNRRAGMLVAHHLADLGHARVAYAGGRLNSWDSQDRLRGLSEGLACRARPLNPAWIHQCNSYYTESGVALARQLLDRPFEVTAMVLANDALALGFMQVALRRGIRIPDDLSVVGFDGVPEGDLMVPGLTTVAQPMRAMGRLACTRLIATIEGSASGPPATIELPMELVRRDSTGAAPRLATRPRGSHRAAS